jgi:2-haloacid dehalogenase
MAMPVLGLKALAFDVFGTVVDYRGTIIREGERLNAARGLALEWARLADAWRACYRPSMDRVMRGELPWTNLDALHRMALDEVLAQAGADAAFSAAERDALNRVWHRLEPWPDAVPGLTRLRAPYVLATLSNGNVALLVDMARHAGLPWDFVMSAELARAYKPDPRVYLMTAELLGLRPAELMLVAAHPSDLRAARAQGLRTALVPRPMEHGPGGAPAPTPDPSFDVTADDFLDLAAKLGA